MEKANSNAIITMTRKQIVWLLVAFAALILLIVIDIPNLDLTGQKALAILAWIIIVLISKCLPIMLANVIFAIMTITMGVISQPNFLAAVGTSPFFLVLSLSVVALGMSKTNLGARIAYLIIKYIGKTPALLVLAIMLTGTFLSALIINLPALLAVCPIVLSVLHELKEEPGTSKLGKAMFLGLAYSAGVGGLVLVTSNGLNATGIAAMTKVDESLTITYGQFAIVGIVMAVVMVITGWLVLCAWFHVNQSSKRLPQDVADRRLKELGKISATEVRFVVILLAMVLCFFFSAELHLTGPTVALIFLAVMLCPYIGLIRFEEAQKEINWALLVQIAFFVAYAGGIINTGVGEWLSNLLFGWLHTDHLLLLIVAMVMFSHIAGFLVPNGGAAPLLIPFVVALAQASGIVPQILVMVVICVCSWTQVQPVQNQYLVVCSNAGGFLEIKDFVIPNLLVSLVWSVIAIPCYYIMLPIVFG